MTLATNSDGSTTINPALTPAPRISGINPGALVQGVDSSVTITGSDLTGAAISYPNGTVGAITYNDATTIIVSLTGTTIGTGNVTVTTVGGSNSISLTVNALLVPTITWSTPASITYGTALSSGQLNAAASVPGSFSYTPAAGTLLAAGIQQLSVNFTPTDTVNYTPATAGVTLTVTPVVILPVYLPRGGTPYFSTISAAYAGAATIDTMELLSLTLTEPVVTFNLQKSITIKGGFDNSFAIQTGMTTIRGNVTVSGGTLVLDRIIIQ